MRSADRPTVSIFIGAEEGSDMPTVLVPSDVLPVLRRFVAQWPALAQSLDLPSEIRVVVDTSIIVGEVGFLVRNRRGANARTALQEAFASGVAVPYFPVEALDEVETKLDEMAKRYGLPRRMLGAVWQSYQHVLRICSTADVVVDEIRLRDPTDLPFIRLHRLVEAHVVLTTDKDIVAAGVPTIAPIAVRLDLRDFARTTALHVSVTTSGTILLAGILAGAVRLAGAVTGLIARAPAPVKLVIAGLAIAAIAVPTLRSAIVQRMRPLMGTVVGMWSVMWPVISKLALDIVEAQERSQELRSKIGAVIPGAMKTTSAQAPATVAPASECQRAAVMPFHPKAPTSASARRVIRRHRRQIPLALRRRINTVPGDLALREAKPKRKRQRRHRVIGPAGR